MLEVVQARGRPQDFPPALLRVLEVEQARGAPLGFYACAAACAGGRARRAACREALRAPPPGAGRERKAG